MEYLHQQIKSRTSSPTYRTRLVLQAHLQAQDNTFQNLSVHLCSGAKFLSPLLESAKLLTVHTGLAAVQGINKVSELNGSDLVSRDCGDS